MSVGFRYLGDAAPGAGRRRLLDRRRPRPPRRRRYLHLVDRRVDMIVTGGANVYPAEVETALVDHPAIADIVVIGLRDPEWGRHARHRRAGRVGRAPTDGEVIAYAKSRLAPYKVPKAVEIVDAIRAARRPRSTAAPRRGPRRLTETSVVGALNLSLVDRGRDVQPATIVEARAIRWSLAQGDLARGPCSTSSARSARMLTAWPSTFLAS